MDGWIDTEIHRVLKKGGLGGMEGRTQGEIDSKRGRGSNREREREKDSERAKEGGREGGGKEGGRKGGREGRGGGERERVCVHARTKRERARVKERETKPERQILYVWLPCASASRTDGGE